MKVRILDPGARVGCASEAGRRARRAQIVGPLLWRVGALSATGILLGLAAPRGVTPLVGALLIGVTPNDPAGLAVVALLLAGIALVATWLPA